MNEVTSAGTDLIFDWCPIREETPKSLLSLKVCRKRRCREVRQCIHGHKRCLGKLNLLFCALGLSTQNCKEQMLTMLSHLTCGSLLWQPKLPNITKLGVQSQNPDMNLLVLFASLILKAQIGFR